MSSAVRAHATAQDDLGPTAASLQLGKGAAFMGAVPSVIRHGRPARPGPRLG